MMTQRHTSKNRKKPYTSKTKEKKQIKVDFQALLDQALNQPGALSEVYCAFHEFSILNQALAYSQCMDRGHQISPLASFNTWKEKGRRVKKGEKAIFLFLPFTKKFKLNESESDEEKKEFVSTFFTLKPHWFVLSQTEGDEVSMPNLPDWHLDKALSSLEISQESFQKLNGNCQGYAYGQTIAVNPLAAYPVKTACHEMAHILLGHTTEFERLTDDEFTPRNLREVEAESVAYIVTSTLGLPGCDSSRAYIQGWLGNEKLSDVSIRKIFSCADKILRAGH